MTAAQRLEPDDTVIDLHEWARRTNAETRRVMGVVVGPELSEYSPPPDKFHRAGREARVYLDGLMTDDEAAACVAADKERVQLALAEARQDEETEPGWHAAAAEYHKDRDNRTLIVEIEPERIERLRKLIADDVSIERAYAELSKPSGVAESTLQAAEFLMQQKDAARLRSWLDRHSASERQAILQHLEQRKGARAQ